MNILTFTPPPLKPRDLRFVHPPAYLCQLAGDWDGGDLGPGWACQEKIDGIRCTWFDHKLWTREGNVIDFAPHIAAELARLETRYGCPAFFDGELIEPGGFHETLSVLASKGKRESRAVFHLFDGMALDDWRADDCMMPLIDRLKWLERAMGDWIPEHFHLVDTLTVRNAEHARDLAEGVWRDGGEGIILKRAASLYRRKRSNDWLKWKRAIEITGEIVSVEHEGAAIVISHRGKRHRVAVPPPMRERVRDTPIGGNCATVRAMEFNERGSLRQPQLVGIGGP